MPAFHLSEVTPAQRRTLIAASLGWALDAFDVLLYSLVLSLVMESLGISKATAGLLNTFTLLASGIGGLIFGLIADRIGRTKALMLSILTYSVCSLGSGLATTIPVLAVFRFVLGLGMGGEWNTGATLVAETWPTHLRAKAMAIVQSSWAWGYAAAALVAYLVLQVLHQNWRVVFFVGILPALVTLWIRRKVPESEMWKKQQLVPKEDQAGFFTIFSPELRWKTLCLLLLNFFGLFAWWGVFSWIAPYLNLPVSKGGRGLGFGSSTTLLVVLNLAGMFPGYVSFGWVAERLGRKRAFVIYLLCAALLVPVFARAQAPWAIMLAATLLAFFGTGFFSGSGLIGSEIFSTQVRARALGFTYNGARALSSVSPYVIGWVGDRKGLSGAFFLCGIAFFLAMVMAMMLPETKGKELG
ncbi:MAG TPA: MFS transporter [Candidatus Saccharimonadales bacterium]|jgi:MFS family permease|nr:MFS transporter [Candidatus Saccharimonadales bacterium]